MNNLKNLLDKYSNEYYNNSKSLVTDEEFDNLKEKYEELSGEEFDFVGYKPLEKFLSIKHKHPMLSLEKIKDIDKLKKWIKNLSSGSGWFSISYKLDGVSISLIYRFGYLVDAVTRGDGVEGDRILHNILNLKNIPHYIEELKDKPYIEIRGEGIISKENFSKMKLKNDDFISARNTASGSIRQKDENIIKTRNVDFLAYYIYGEKGLYNDLDLCLEHLEEWNFKTPKWAVNNELSEIIDIVNKFEENREKYEYEIDGLVINTVDKYYFESLGNTNHHPRGAVALKFKSKEEYTTLENIEWSVSATGRINPVGILKPVQVGDVTIGRVSLHNLDIIKNLNLKINDKVLIKRSNEVIPYLEESIHTENSKPISLPRVCPSCKKPIFKDDQFLYCKNDSCFAVMSCKIQRFCGVLGIDGVGESIANNITKNLIEYGEKYYDVMEFILDDWIEVSESDVIGKKLHEQMIQAKSKLTPEKCLTSLFIDNISHSASEKILNKYRYSQLFRLTKSDYTVIEGIGNTLAENLINNVNLDNKAYWYFAKYLVNYKKEDTIASNKLEGFKICISGKMNLEGEEEEFPREKVQQMIKENGGISKSSVTKDLDYLIVGEGSGQKREKAIAMGCEIISFDEFLEMIS